MVAVYHVDVLKVHGSGLVGDVHRVLERQVPHGEGLELGVASLHAALVLVVELREAGGELAGTGARGVHDHERTAGLHEVVAAKALVAHGERDVGGVAVDEVVAGNVHAHLLHVALPGLGVGLACKVRDHDVLCHEAHVLEGVQQAQRVVRVGEADVAPALVVLDVVRVDDDHGLGLVVQLLQHAGLEVGLEAWQHAACVVVVEELAAKFEVELAPELADPLADAGGLHLDVLVLVESKAHGTIPSPRASTQINLLRMVRSQAYEPNCSCGKLSESALS